MRYENEVCPGCGQAFNKNDDIVVCPQCGTPQHRECWQKDSRCVNYPRHAEGFMWSPCEQKQEEPPKEEQQANAVICQSCGAPNAPDSLHCQYCGNPLTADGGFVPPPAFEPEMPPEFSHDNIGNEKTADVAFYVRTSLKKYLPLFARFSRRQKKLSWNWAAFFISPYWFFYRRLNKLGIIFVAILATLTLAMSVPFSEYTEVYENVYEELSSDDISEERLEQINGELLEAMKPISPFAAAYLIVHVVSALVADKAYYKKMENDFEFIRRSGAKGEAARMLMASRGGVSILGFAAGLFGYTAFYKILIILSDKLSTYIK